MANISFVRRLFSRWRCEQRYHTPGTQALALIPPTAVAVFLFMGLQNNVGTVCALAFGVVLFSLFVQSRMAIDRPSGRVLRQIIKLVEICLGMIVAIVIVFLAGSFTNMAILYIAYVTGAILTSELHGRGFVQLGS